MLLTAPANGGHETFDLITLTRLASGLPHADQVLIFAGFAVAFAVKIPLIPFHSWLPDAYTEAPTAGSMILAGILFKLGAYGLLRFGVFLLPRGATDLGPLLLTLAAVGITYGALVTVMQKDLKRWWPMPPSSTSPSSCSGSSPSAPRASPGECSRWSTTG